MKRYSQVRIEDTEIRIMDTDTLLSQAALLTHCDVLLPVIKK